MKREVLRVFKDAVDPRILHTPKEIDHAVLRNARFRACPWMRWIPASWARRSEMGLVVGHMTILAVARANTHGGWMVRGE